MAIIVLGDWNNTSPVAPAGHDLATVQVDRGGLTIEEALVQGVTPKFNVAVKRATTSAHGTIIYDASGSAYKYLGSDGNWHDVLPAGGTTGQALVKNSDTDFDVIWGDVAASGGGGGPRTIGCVIDGAGSVPGTGLKVRGQVAFDCTITGWTILTDQAGSASFTVKKSDYATYPTTSSIVAAANPAVSSAQKATSSTLTGWTTTITAGDVIEFWLDSVSTCTWIVIQLEVDTGSSSSTTLPDWLTNHPDAPPSSPDTMDDEFSTGSLDAKWTVWDTADAANASRTFANGSLILAAPGDNSGNNVWHGIEQNLPAGSWEFTAKIAVPYTGNNWFLGGLYLRESVSGNLIHYGYAYSNGQKMKLSRYSAPNTWASEIQDAAMVMPFWPATYIRIKNDTLNLTFQWSLNGIIWNNFSVEYTLGFFGSTPDKIGIGIDVVLATDVTGLMTCDWFRRTA